MASRKKRDGFPIYHGAFQVSAREVCRAYGIEHSFLISMIEYGIIELHDDQIMDTSALHSIGIASRLHRELQVNTAGIAIILDLLDELESAKTRLSVLERHHFGKYK
jgi:chaperone modulatory protein CbpM